MLYICIQNKCAGFLLRTPVSWCTPYLVGLCAFRFLLGLRPSELQPLWLDISEIHPLSNDRSDMIRLYISHKQNLESDLAFQSSSQSKQTHRKMLERSKIIYRITCQEWSVCLGSLLLFCLSLHLSNGFLVQLVALAELHGTGGQPKGKHVGGHEHGRHCIPGGFFQPKKKWWKQIRKLWANKRSKIPKEWKKKVLSQLLINKNRPLKWTAKGTVRQRGSSLWLHQRK